MVVNRKVTGTASSLPAGIGFGLLLSLGITLLGCALIAYLMLTQKLQEEAVGYASIVVLALASAAGAFLSAGMIKRMRAQVCLMTGAGYYLALLGCNALIFGGQYAGLGVTAIVVFLGCGCAAIFGMIRQKGSKAKFKKPAYR